MPSALLKELVIQKNKLFENQPDGWGIAIPATIPTTLENLYAEYGHAVDLLEIKTSTNYYRYANEFADITWNGFLWSKRAMEPGEYRQGDNDSTFRVKVSNIDGTVEELMEDQDGWVRDTAIYRYVHTGYSTPLLAREYEILSAIPDPEWINFELGFKSVYSDVFPAHVYSANTCRYGPHQTDVCAYVNSTSCDRTFQSCLDLGQELVFGGQPGIKGQAIDVE